VRNGDGVAWLSLPVGGSDVTALGARLVGELPTDLTDPRHPPRRAPGAHVTVVRRADQALVSALQSERHGRLEVGWTADRICMFRSYPGRGGSVYEPLVEVAIV
jgi:2'-5' RNA ligase